MRTPSSATITLHYPLRQLRLPAIAALLVWSAACDETKPGAQDSGLGDTALQAIEADADTDADSDTDADTDADSDTDADTDVVPTGGWTFSGNPCDSRTDDLWFDDPEHGYLGCGQAASGEGFWMTEDGGLTWQDVPSSPPGWFNSFRVNDIFRDDHGTLYASGTGQGMGVVSVGAGGELGDVWVPGALADTSFTVGTFRVNSAGFAVVEDFAGAGIMTRQDADVASEAWDAVYGTWTTDGQNHGILDMAMYDDRFFACGSNILEAPKVFVQSDAPTTELALDPVELSSGAFGWTGELWSIAVDASGIATVGVDEVGNVAHLLTTDHDADMLDPSSWRDFSVAELYPSDQTWMQSVCRSGDTIVGVGKFSTANRGLIMRSTDNGVSWTDVTPTEVDVPNLWDCVVHEDGSFLVTAAGWTALYRN
jgi:hypothetical protein